MSWFKKLRESLGFSRETVSRVETLSEAKKPLDAAFWEEMEDILLSADFGVATTEKILDGLRTVAKQELWRRSDEAIARFKEDVRDFLALPGGELRMERGSPTVILIIGVNGSGKTTTIGKLAHLLRHEGKRVMVVAGDTFRAAASEQLAIWAQRSGSEFFSGRDGSDPASVVFDGVGAAKARGIDVVLVDTAGRLQTKVNLMEELKKIGRVIERATGSPPTETLLVLDGTTGQNGLSQARLFDEATKLTGVIVTKLDSTSKGGVLVGIVDLLEIPIKFIGLGEGIDELRPFDADSYVKAIFDHAA
ncbi:MAG TPA: signal recognition particle-docking protein FtsY [Candidatus Baltobacteraceae bacterium]|nr:signal recognition particle-docking protein FtsY [Candidatus Baltobacteraceae bacterium]